MARAAGVEPPRVDEVLALVGLMDEAGRRVKGYSLGMRQRLGIAASLLGRPRILVLDEPANGLDPEGIRWLRDLLRHQADSGVTVLVSSHVLAEMAQTVDDVVVIAGGRLVAQGPMAELTSRAGAGVRVRTPQAAQLAGALREQGFTVDAPGEDMLVVHGATSAVVGATATARGVVLHELVATGSTLEDVFLALTGSGTPGAGHAPPVGGPVNLPAEPAP
jgi:ABC-2 type transport system ATP-binding protein